jgi:hypothetical protein
LGVEITVIVSACTDRRGDDDTTSVDCLPDILEVNATGDFLDEDGGESLGAELLVHT